MQNEISGCQTHFFFPFYFSSEIFQGDQKPPVENMLQWGSLRRWWIYTGRTLTLYHGCITWSAAPLQEHEHTCEIATMQRGQQNDRKPIKVSCCLFFLNSSLYSSLVQTGVGGLNIYISLLRGESSEFLTVHGRQFSSWFMFYFSRTLGAISWEQCTSTLTREPLHISTDLFAPSASLGPTNPTSVHLQ